MMKFFPFPLVLLLSACVGGAPKSLEVAYYDLSAEPAGSGQPASTPLRTLEVVPGAWLSSNAMHYRLAYADGNRREHFAHARWSAQPAELIATRLQRSLLTGTQAAAPYCRLRIDLDDLSQVFGAPGSSRLVLDVRLTLYGVQQRVLTRRTLSLSRPAGADARAGAAASGALTAELAQTLRDWAQHECAQTSAASQMTPGR